MTTYYLHPDLRISQCVPSPPGKRVSWTVLLRRSQPDVHLLMHGFLNSFHLCDPGLALPVIEEQDMEVVCHEVLELFLVPHFDSIVSGKTFDRDEPLLFEREVGFFELLKRPDHPKVPQEFQEALGQRFVKYVLFHERAVDTGLSLDGPENPHSRPPPGSRLPPPGIHRG